MNDTIKEVAGLCCLLESNATSETFTGEKVAEMFNQILSGHSAESVASKHGIVVKVKNYGHQIGDTCKACQCIIDRFGCGCNPPDA